VSSQKLPVFFLSHGGGPWPWIDDMKSHFATTYVELQKLGKIYCPKAVLVISGHWEEPSFKVSSSSSPSMIYDYHGFPPHTYHIQYKAPGSPDLAKRVRDLLQQNGIQVNEDSSRGFDHGTFVPLSLIFPEANIPIVQLSLKQSLDPAEHVRLGACLEPLRQEGILIIASGLSYHNLRSFFKGGGPVSEIFEKWLTQTVESNPEIRNQRLVHWSEAPKAREAHPREDHLIPLMVAAGAAGNDIGKRFILDKAFDVSMASYQFG